MPLETITQVLRTTALISALCVAAAMVSEGMKRSAAVWLIALAMSHTGHGIFILLRMFTYGLWMPWLALIPTVLLGGLAYVFIYLMAWRRRTHPGLWWVWTIFLLGYAPKAVATPWRGAVAAALIVGAVMRIVATRREKQLAASS